MSDQDNMSLRELIAEKEAAFAALEAENARNRNRYHAALEAGMEQEKRAQRAGAACAEKDAAIEGLLRHPGIADMDPRDKDPEDHALERAAREALSDTCGQRYRDIVEAAAELEAFVRRSVNVGPLTCNPKNEAALWVALRQALAATEPTDE